MPRVFTADELIPISNNPGRVFSASELEPIPAGQVEDRGESTLSEKIGKAAEYLPAIGAAAGGVASLAAAPGTMGASLVGGSALAGLGAAAGKAGEQLVKRAVGEEAPRTSFEAAKQIAKEGTWTAALNAAFAKAIPMLKPAAQKIAPGILKTLQGIDEKLATRVINDPEMLSRAKPMDVAKKEFSEFFENIGFNYGPKSVKAATGKLALSDNAADDFISETINKIERFSGTTTGKEGGTKLIDLPENKESVRQVIQEALAARYSMGDAIKRAARAGNDTKSRLFIEARNEVDDWLETMIPGFSEVRKNYAEAKAKEVFSSVFPKNQNATTSVLRGIAAAGAGIFNPISAAAISPIAGQIAIRGVSAATKAPAIAAVSTLLGEKAANFTEDIINRGIETERKDHPDIPEQYLPNLVADELKSDPHFYDKED